MNVGRCGFSVLQTICHLITSLLPFMNKDNAAKERTVTDASVNSNIVGMFSTDALRWRRFQKIRGYYDKGGKKRQ